MHSGSEVHIILTFEALADRRNLVADIYRKHIVEAGYTYYGLKRVSAYALTQQLMFSIPMGTFKLCLPKVST
jgi:hypothetical protein